MRRVPVKELGAFCDRPQPLAALYLLERRDPTQHGTTIDMTPVSRAEALVALIRHCFATQLLSALTHQRRRAALLVPLVQRVPVRRLVYPAGFEYLPRVRQSILDDLKTVS